MSVVDQQSTETVAERTAERDGIQDHLTPRAEPGHGKTTFNNTLDLQLLCYAFLLEGLIFSTALVPMVVLCWFLADMGMWFFTLGLGLCVYLYPFLQMLLIALAYRLHPLQQGEHRGDSTAARRFYVTMGLYILMGRTARNLLPTPFPGHLFYRLAAPGIHPTAQINDGAAIADPSLTVIGAGCLVADGARIYCHYTRYIGAPLHIDEVRIGEGVMVGVGAIIWPGVVIGDGAVVAAGAVVRPHTIIPAGSCWGGVPARPLDQAAKNRNGGEASLPSITNRETSQ